VVVAFVAQEIVEGIVVVQTVLVEEERIGLAAAAVGEVGWDIVVGIEVGVEHVGIERVVYSLPSTAVVQHIEEQVVPRGVVDVPEDVGVEVVRWEVVLHQQEQRQQAFD